MGLHISMSYYMTLFLIVRCEPLRNIKIVNHREYFPLFRHIYIFSGLMYHLEIAYAICIKVSLALNFKIMSVQMFS